MAPRRRRPLIDEPVEAWSYGPVVPSLYHRFKRFGRDPITVFARNGARGPLVDSSDEQTMEVLDRVWSGYKRYTGIQLSNMTHAAGTPWTQIHESTEGRRKRRGLDIPDELMKRYFISTARNRAQGTPS